jgi:hypothetical protein
MTSAAKKAWNPRTARNAISIIALSADPPTVPPSGAPSWRTTMTLPVNLPSGEIPSLLAASCAVFASSAVVTGCSSVASVPWRSRSDT